MSNAVQSLTHNRLKSKTQQAVSSWSTYRSAQLNGHSEVFLSELKSVAQSRGNEPDAVKGKWVSEYKRMGRAKPFDL